MRAAHFRPWFRVGLAVTATVMLTAVVMSAVAKVQDASDRVH